MKASRRHDLKENVLAKDLGKAGHFVRKYRRLVLGGLLGVIVVVVVVLYASSSRSTSRQMEWRHYWASSGDNGGPARQQLWDLAEGTSQRGLAAWTYLRIGQAAYSQLCRQLYDLPAAEREQLTKEARDAYDLVLSGYGDFVATTAEAHLGLGRLAETVRDFPAARAAYERASDLSSKGAALSAVQAEWQLARLNDLRVVVNFPASAPAADREATTGDPGAMPETQPAG